MQASPSITRAEDGATVSAKAVMSCRPSAVRDNAVFLMLNGALSGGMIKTGGTTSQGLRVEEGLYGR